MRFIPLSLMALVAPALSSACIVHSDPPHDPYGDIAFDWSFDGIPSCDEAGVDEVDVAVFSGNALVLDLQREPCEGGGLVLSELLEGDYEVFIDAYDRESRLLYSGSFAITVVGGQVNEAGVVILDLVGDPIPVVETGALAFFWSFLYPTNATAEISCAAAGVEEVDVIITPEGSAGAYYEDTRPCSDEGLELLDLPAGRYTLELVAYGSYANDDVMLYEAQLVDIDVLADTYVDLDDIALARVDESFSDFDVAWQFSGASCDSAGIDSVVLAFRRDGFQNPESVIEVDCDALNVVQPTFVPSGYTVSATAQGIDHTYVAAVEVDLPPDTVAVVDLTLVPVD